MIGQKEEHLLLDVDCVTETAESETANKGRGATVLLIH